MYLDEKIKKFIAERFGQGANVAVTMDAKNVVVNVRLPYDLNISKAKEAMISVDLADFICEEVPACSLSLHVFQLENPNKTVLPIYLGGCY